MSDLDQTFAQYVQRIGENKDLMDQFVHGGAEDTVQTEGGPIPTLAGISKAVSESGGYPMYTDTGTGIASTIEGQYFKTPSPDEHEAEIIYRHDPGAVASERGRTPSILAFSSIRREIEDTASLRSQQPNLYPDPEFLNIDGTDWTGPATYGVEWVDGYRCLRVAGSYLYLTIPLSDDESSEFSASFVVQSGDISRIYLGQYPESGGELTRATVSSIDSSDNPQRVEFKSVAIDPDCARLRVVIDAGVGNTVYVRAPLVALGSSVAYRSAPPEKVQYNYAADPVFTGEGLLPDNDVGRRVFADGQTYLEITGSGNITRTYGIPAVGMWAPGSTIRISADLYSDGTDGAELTYIPYDSNGDEITANRIAVRNASDLSGFVTKKASGVIPEGTAEVHQRLFKTSAGSIARWRNVVAAPRIVSDPDAVVPVRLPISTRRAAIYMDASGDDNNAGTSESPVATLSAAIQKMGGVGTVIVAGGDYSEADFASSGAIDVTVVCFDNDQRARVLGGTPVTGLVKTVGYTNIYEGALETEPSGPLIFEHETPDASTLIPDAQRHPLQRGLEYRLPSTRLYQVASLADLDAAERPGWYWEDGTLYVHAPSGSDPTTETYYVPSVSVGPFVGQAGRILRVSNIESWYSTYGFDFSGCAYYEATNLRAVGARVFGIIRNNATGVERLLDLCGCGVDGSSGHNPLGVDNTGVQIQSYDSWCHDNYDDGDSLHERCIGSIYGGLYEYNGDRGIATAFGAHVTAYNVLSRYNFQESGAGEGFGVVGSVQPDEGGIGTQMDCYNCVSVGDRYGFGSHADAGVMNCYNCHSVESTAAGYSADRAGAVLNLYRCHDSDSLVAKDESGGGVVNTVNGELVT